MADDVEIKFGASTGDAEEGVDRVKGKLKELKDPLEEAIEGAKGLKEMLEGLAVGLGVEKLAEIVNAQAEMAERISNMAAAVGVSIEQYSRLSATLIAFGGDAESAQHTIELLEQQMGSALADDTGRAAKLFGTLGISIADIKRGQEDVPGFLELLRQKWHEFADDAGKTAVFRELLGRGFDTLVPLLKANAEEMAKFTQAIKDTNAALDEGTAEKLEKLAQAHNMLHLAWSGFWQEFSADSAGAMAKFDSGITHALEQITKLMKGQEDLKTFLGDAGIGRWTPSPARFPFGTPPAPQAPDWGGPIGDMMKGQQRQRSLAQEYAGQGYPWAQPKPSITPPGKQDGAGEDSDASDATMAQLRQVLDQMEVDTGVSYQKQRQFAIDFWQGVAAQAQSGSKLEAQARDEANRLILDQARDAAEKRKEIERQANEVSAEETRKYEEAKAEAFKRGEEIVQELQRKQEEEARRALEKEQEDWRQAFQPIDQMLQGFVEDATSGHRKIGQEAAQAAARMVDEYAMAFAKIGAQELAFQALNALNWSNMAKSIGDPFGSGAGGLGGLLGSLFGGGGAASQTALTTMQTTAATTQQAAAATQMAAAGTMQAAVTTLAASSAGSGIGGAGALASLFDFAGTGAAAEPGELLGALATPLMGFDVGSWSVPNDMVARIHANEMIIPANEAGQIRDGAVFAPGGRGAVGGDVHLHVHAIDGASVKRFFADHGDKVADALRGARRNFSTAMR